MIYPSRAKRPKWSLKTHFWAAVLIAVLASVCVFVISEKNIWVELEITVSVLLVISFAYFLFLFYHGVRFEKNETFSFTWKTFRLDNSWFEFLGTGGPSGLFTEIGAEAGPLGCVVGALLDLVVSFLLIIILAFLIWLGFNIAATGFVALLLPLYFLFRRSLRIAVARGRTCRGNLGKSLEYAFVVTVMNMIWLYLVISAGYSVSKWLIKS
jgi:hypothetical protein